MFVPHNEKQFISGYVIDVNDFKLDALGRNLLKRLESSGILPFFSMNQPTHVPAYVDQFFHFANEKTDTDDNGKPYKYIQTEVAGFPLTVDDEDIADVRNGDST